MPTGRIAVAALAIVPHKTPCAVLGNGLVNAFQTIIRPERANFRSSHVRTDALHDSKNGGRVFVPESRKVAGGGRCCPRT